MFDKLPVSKTFYCVFIYVFVGEGVDVWGDEKVEMGRKLLYKQ